MPHGLEPQPSARPDYNQRHSKKNQQDADHITARKPLVEHHDTYEQCRKRLQRPENGSRRGTDVPDGFRNGHHGYQGREQSQSQRIHPLRSFRKPLQIHPSAQAAELGLGTCIMGWFDEKKVKKLLGIKGKRVPLLISLGYPAGETRKKARKSLEEMSSWNQY